MAGKIWDGMGYWGVVPYHGMVWYSSQIPSHSHSKRYGILCSPSGKLSLFRQCASHNRLSLSLGPISFGWDGMPHPGSHIDTVPRDRWDKISRGISYIFPITIYYISYWDIIFRSYIADYCSGVIFRSYIRSYYRYFLRVYFSRINFGLTWIVRFSIFSLFSLNCLY